MKIISLNKQSGQTLIETLVAIFILVMGIMAALGLAVYSLNASTNVSKQIVATGLAREGIEAVRNMRDTNWLKGTLANDCHNYVTGDEDQLCYANWLGDSGCNGVSNDQGYCIFNTGSGTKNFRLQLDPDPSKKFWTLNEENQNEFGLNLDTNIGGSGFTGFFVSANGLVNGSSDFYRKIIITKDTSGVFSQDSMERLVVSSQVWWVDRKCPRVNNFNSAKQTCRLELQTYLTNWKNY